MVNNNDLLAHIIEIKEDTAAINEHLKALNGKVAKNVLHIEDNRNKVHKAEVKLARYVGAVGVLFMLLQVALNFIF